ncbi:lipopolysaccharide transport periplasmic protein LptA [Laribacter hongkongensis]|uniref:lipopolysaccharide transport periplasmic protein LptA n=1 Tax=Laribacter hongkongensis TaxID=168471 RepID=UPI001EFC8888|nr:lipopolysaccharide transport periplasmic protein LptA [Laribacter hongkongensis]MCG9032839.1 lipopolysaccharide transport periplasmic protein LptA [Laribacter hongkongensis]MCG9092825.1 lipopolysaccharide transport periplasmic protein LptA [Laribacter hongkongensis]
MSRNNLAGLLLISGLAGLSVPVHAEQADRSKPIVIEADRANLDQLKGVTVYEGNVILTQGTARITGNRLVVTEDNAKQQIANVYGNPATFKQRLDADKDGKVEWVDGKGQRIEYDSGKDLVRIWDNGRVTRGGDVVTGNYIVYNARTEQFEASGQQAGPNGQPQGKGRVTVTIQPRQQQQGTK